MREPHPRDLHLDLGRHLVRAPARAMRAIPEALQAARFVLDQPRMHRLTRHPEPRRHIGHRLAITDHGQHSLIPLLRH
jgi:hypothetical protein